MSKKAEYKVAVLIHILQWQSPKNRLSLGNGIYFHKSSAHPVGKLYEKECRDNKMDNGEPYMYETCILFHDWEAVIYGGGFPRDPYSYINQLINVLAIYYNTVVDMVRVFTSSDDFKTYKTTQEIDYAGAQSEFLLENDLLLQGTDFKAIKKMWGNVGVLWKANKSQSRVINALTHFYYSWNVHYLEQTAIHISIVLEILFSPHSKDELSHQIAFNVCQFLGTSKMDKQEIYKKMKKYYAVRSKIMHGEKLNGKEEDIIPEFFRTICDLLIRIISDKRLAGIFDDNAKRKQYLDELIFK